MHNYSFQQTCVAVFASGSQTGSTDGTVAKKTRTQQRCSDEILRQGGLILFCDYAVGEL